MLATVAIWARGSKSSRYGIVSHNLLTNIFLQIKILLLEIRNFIYIEKKRISENDSFQNFFDRDFLIFLTHFVYGSDFIVPSKLFTYQKLKIFNILKKSLLQNYSF